MDLLHKEGYDYDYVFDWTIVDRIDKTPIGGNTIERNTANNQPSMNVNDDASADNVVVGGIAGITPTSTKAKQAAKQPARPQQDDQDEAEDEVQQPAAGSTR